MTLNGEVATTLKRVPELQRQLQALVYQISQVSITLGRNTGAFGTARSEVLTWMNGRAGRPLPERAWHGLPFELEEIGAQHVEAVAIEKPQFWAARLDDADKNVPLRSWITEVALAEREDGLVIFGARLTAVVRGPKSPFERSIPGFVRKIVAVTGAELDDRPISESPWIVATEDDVDALVALLCDPRRRVDVIVVALAEGATDPSSTIIDAEDIARKTIGAAHVAVLTGPASFRLTDRVGREFSVFRQAVRTYRPGFNVDLDEPFAHPLGLPHRIVAWEDGGPAAYSRLVVSQALIRSVSAADSERLVPSFLKVKRTAAEIRLDEARRTGSSDAALLSLYEEDNDNLRRQLAQEKEKNDALLVLAEEERDAALDAAQQARERAKPLRRRIESLERATQGGAARPQSVPSTLDNVETWCEENLPESVALHARAYRGLKSPVFEDVTLIYKALLLLRDYYVPMRRDGGINKTDTFRDACQALGLTEEPTGSETRAGEQGEEYHVKYGGRRVYLDRHLKKGASRDPRRCFRLYFYWDQEDEQVVVGWLPSHLDTRIT
jgi:hypothetical protein